MRHLAPVRSGIRLLICHARVTDLGYKPTVRLRKGLPRTIQHFQEEEIADSPASIVSVHGR